VSRERSEGVAVQLVLSLFPGIGLLDMAFEDEGFCVVRGPDLLWGGDVRRFHPPAGRFDGVIGGPPCQAFSRFRYLNPAAGKHGNLVPEFERVVSEARPRWFVMENVPDAPIPCVSGYFVTGRLVSNREIGEEQDRTRRFSFGTGEGLELAIESATFRASDYRRAVTGSNREVPVALVRDGKGGHQPKTTVHGGHGAPFDRPNWTIAEMCELQGLPADFLSEAPFTAHGKRKVIGNGVPLPMGRAVARAVKEAIR
jgi:DNA (cytosine-5)-methyltransferase 1